MDKEELIKLIEAMTVEEINSFSISYFTEKQESNYGYDCSKERELKVISYGTDINKRLEYIRRDMDSMFEITNRNNQMMIEEMINEKLNKE